VKRIHRLFPVILAVLAITPVFAQRIDIHLDSQPAVSGGCPAKLHFSGDIRTYDAGLQVTYRWLRSDGVSTDHTVTFGKTGAHPVSDSWTISKRYSGWEQLVIVSPKRLQTIKANFTVNCGR